MLDESLYALHCFIGSAKIEFREPALLDSATEQSVVYRVSKHADDGLFSVTEPISNTVLAKATVLSNKLRLVELLNPPLKVECKSTGFLTYEQRFSYEKFDFEWHRSAASKLSTSGEKEYSLYMVRKPEADWLLATYRPGGSHGSLQFLDYQLKRVDIEDLKGLEIVIVTLLSTFLEFKEGEADAGMPSRPAKEPLSTALSRPLVPIEAPKPKAERPAPIQSSEPNDMTVRDSQLDEAYVKQALKLLSDKSMAYITLRAESAETVQKAIRIAAEIKTKRLKVSGEELHQYVKEQRPANASHVPRIDLRPEAKFEPPKAVQIWLSRMELPELGAKVSLKGPKPSAKASTKRASPNRLQKPPSPSKTPSPRTSMNFFGRRSPAP